MSLFGLRRGKKEEQEPDLAKVVHDRLESHPSWQVNYGGYRLCPFCARPVTREKSPETEEAFVQHLPGCPAWEEGEGSELDPAALEGQALRVMVKRGLAHGGSWAVLDEDRHWVNPYSGKPTRIQLPEGNQITPELLDAIVHELKGSPAFSPLRPPKREEEIRRSLAVRRRQNQLRDRIKREIQEEQALRFTDPQGRWICPWCRQPVLSVDVSSDFAVRNAAPQGIARHLQNCGAYREQRPRASVTELRGLYPEEEQEAESDSRLIESGWLDEIRNDLEAMRSAMESRQGPSAGEREMQKSLDLARQRQLKMLPKMPRIDGLELDVWYAPCASVSGDFYDVIKVGPNATGLLIGDVSGHGIEAALIMSMAKKALQMHGRGEADPSETLKKANRELFGELETGTFLTVFYAIFDMEAREVRCCRAGHNPALVVSGEETPEVREIQPGGMGVGINDGSIFERTLDTMTIPLEDGTSVVLYTDGVTETRDDAGEEYGVQRLKQTLARFAEFRPTYLIHLVRADLETFSRHRPADDDQTIICIRVG